MATKPKTAPTAPVAAPVATPAATPAAAAPSSLSAAVKAEAQNWQAVGSLYGQAARELAALFESKGNGAVHLYMVAAQDLTGDPLVWNRCMAGTKKALAALPASLVFTATRDFRPTHRAKAPLFELATKDSVTAAKTAAASEQEAKAKAIESAAAEERAAVEREIDASITPQMIADSVIAECDRLGLSLADVFAIIAAKIESAPIAKAA